MTMFDLSSEKSNHKVEIILSKETRTLLELNDQIDFVVDVNPYKHGKFVPWDRTCGQEPRNA
jgi:hypothetical protein